MVCWCQFYCYPRPLWPTHSSCLKSWYTQFITCSLGVCTNSNIVRRTASHYAWRVPLLNLFVLILSEPICRWPSPRFQNLSKPVGILTVARYNVMQPHYWTNIRLVGVRQWAGGRISEIWQVRVINTYSFILLAMNQFVVEWVMNALWLDCQIYVIIV